jgi:Transposase domain (DUF772)
MMGERQVPQDALFYEFSLERHVPEKHLLRAIDRFVDLSGVRGHLAPFYSETGRPSIDPELLIRMLIVGYCFGIRSERRLCEEVHLTSGIAGSADWVLMATCRTTRPFPRHATAGSATPTFCANCSRRWFGAAWPRAWSVARALPSMPV